MSDRTHIQLRVLDCPLDQAQAVIDLIDQENLGLEFVEDDQPSTNQLGLGLAYINDEITCGSADLIAKHLQEIAPGASWEVWEDPAYSWLGTLIRFTPDLGVFTADCDVDGVPYFTDQQVLDFVDENMLSNQLKTRLGRNHAVVLNDLADDNDGRVLSPAGDV